MLLDRWFFFRRFPGLVIISLVPLFALGLQQLGWLDPFDGWLRDRFVQYAPMSVEDAGRVLVVQHEPDAPDMDSVTGVRVVDQLLELDAKLVVLLQLPDDADEHTLQQLANHPVVIGRYLHKDPQAIDPLRLERWPAVPPGLPVGVVQAPELNGGISRYFLTRVAKGIDGAEPLPMVIQSTLQAMDSLNPEPSRLLVPSAADRVYVDFHGFPQSFPSIDLARVLTGELSRELVADKVIVVANGSSHAEFGIPVPSTHGTLQVSTAIWQGLAVNALLSERQWAMAPGWLNALLLFLTAVVALILLPNEQLHAGLRLMLMLSAVTTALALGILWWWSVWIPATSMILCLLSSGIFSSRIITQRNTNTLWRMSTHLTQHNAGRLDADDPLQSGDPWPALTHLARQILPVRRMICLEVDGADQRLTVARSFSCESGDLVEQRRDLTRAPWKDLVDENLPLKISELPTARPLLVENEKEDQYVIPLRYANELCGFWVLCVDRHAVASIPRFREVTQIIANDIATQLYRRRDWQQQHTFLNSWLSYFSFEFSNNANTRISRSMFNLEDRLSDIEDLFNQLEDATLCFDMFGRVVFVNQSMTDLLSHSQTDVFASSPLQFISHLTNFSEDDAREILQSIVLVHDEVMLKVHDQWSEKINNMIVRIYAIHENLSSESSATGDEEARPIKGIVFQVVNVESVTEPHRLKTMLAQRMDYSIRNRLASMQTASALLQGDGLSSDLRQKVIETISRNTDEITDTLRTARPYLHPDATTKTEHAVMDARSSILSATDKLSDLADQKKITFAVELPELPYLVRGNARHFREGLRGVLELLIDEAYENTNIEICLRQTNDDLQLNVNNKGFGIPSERLNSFLFDDGDVDSERIRSIRTLSERVKSWDGELRVDSAVGTGITFSLILPKLL